jgi:hypothetical protein
LDEYDSANPEEEATYPGKILSPRQETGLFMIIFFDC